MRKYVFCAGFISIFVLVSNLTVVKADERDDEIGALKTQVQELMQRIEKLEAGQANAKEEITKVKETATTLQSSRVDLVKTLAKLKMKGRAAFGYFDSGKAGSYPSGSFE